MTKSAHQRYFFPGDIKVARKKAGWTQTELAQRAGFARGAVSHWENEQTMVAGMAAAAFVEALTDAGQQIESEGFRLNRFEAKFEYDVRVLHDKELQRRDSIRCKAHNRKGERCRAKALPGRRTCKHHGGLSTGPKSEAGKERIRQAQKKRWAEYRASM